jgi:hypothetical protein
MVHVMFIGFLVVLCILILYSVWLLPNTDLQEEIMATTGQNKENGDRLVGTSKDIMHLVQHEHDRLQTENKTLTDQIRLLDRRTTAKYLKATANLQGENDLLTEQVKSLSTQIERNTVSSNADLANSTAFLKNENTVLLGKNEALKQTQDMSDAQMTKEFEGAIKLVTNENISLLRDTVTLTQQNSSLQQQLYNGALQLTNTTEFTNTINIMNTEFKSMTDANVQINESLTQLLSLQNGHDPSNGNGVPEQPIPEREHLYLAYLASMLPRDPAKSCFGPSQSGYLIYLNRLHQTSSNTEGGSGIEPPWGFSSFEYGEYLQYIQQHSAHAIGGNSSHHQMSERGHLYLAYLASRPPPNPVKSSPGPSQSGYLVYLKSMQGAIESPLVLVVGTPAYQAYLNEQTSLGNDAGEWENKQSNSGSMGQAFSNEQKQFENGDGEWENKQSNSGSMGQAFSNEQKQFENGDGEWEIKHSNSGSMGQAFSNEQKQFENGDGEWENKQSNSGSMGQAFSNEQKQFENGDGEWEIKHSNSGSMGQAFSDEGRTRARAERT